jgi:hypothetical protein
MVAKRDMRRRRALPPQRGQLGGVGSEIRITSKLTGRRQSAQWYS